MVAGSLWVGLLAYQVWTYPAYSEASADAAIVLGATTRNGVPTAAYRRRIDAGIALYRAGRVQVLILSGGTTPGEPVSNAEAARNYALSCGIPAQDLLCEPFSRNTRENLAFSQVLAWSRGLRSFLLVSDPLHMKRAMDLARAIGLQAHPAATRDSWYADLPARMWFLRRETAGQVVRLGAGAWAELVSSARRAEAWRACVQSVRRYDEVEARSQRQFAWLRSERPGAAPALAGALAPELPATADVRLTARRDPAPLGLEVAFAPAGLDAGDGTRPAPALKITL